MLSLSSDLSKRCSSSSMSKKQTNKYKTTTKTTILDLVTPKTSIFNNFTAKISHTYYCDPKSNITNMYFQIKKNNKLEM